ncbi:MAG: hypothetical protein IMZ52_09620 [Actinobacteria bacterium]|nr:hypothetical protein [Actinomycetota bacterium]
MLTIPDGKIIKIKQLALGLSENDSLAVVENLREFFDFSGKQTDFAEYIMRFVEQKHNLRKKWKTQT